MITKKLAVPLVNDKILQQAEHCYIATSSVSEEGFEFLRSRISPKCKMDIVTGLDEPSSPAVMWKVLRHYQGRINFHIYTRNTLHANLFVFDLPFRKSVAFVGSGSLSIEGLKDSEELFWKITDAKEIESLMSWYTSYFQFGTPLTEGIARAYESLYPRLKAREVRSMQEKRDLMGATATSMDAVRFRNQFFQRDDFSVFTTENSFSDNASLRLVRGALAEKLMKLHSMLEGSLSKLKLDLIGENLRSADPVDHPGEKIDSMWLVYRNETLPAVSFRIGITAINVTVSAVIVDDRRNAEYRRNFFIRLEDATARQSFFQNVGLLKGFQVEAGGRLRAAESFRSDQDLLAFIDREEARAVEVVFGRAIAPGDTSLSAEAIAGSIAGELTALRRLFP